MQLATMKRTMRNLTNTGDAHACGCAGPAPCVDGDAPGLPSAEAHMWRAPRHRIADANDFDLFEIAPNCTPAQADEFTCSRCSLICHVARQSAPGVCNECA